MARQIRPVKATAPPPPPKPAPQLNFKGKGNRSVFLVMLALPLVSVTTVVLYRRVYLGQPKRVQQGEYTPDGGLRIFDKQEKDQHDKETWMTRIFGTEK